MKVATLEGVQIVIAHTKDGRLFALRDICPHMNAKLSDGLLLNATYSPEPGVYALADDDFVIRCPWHAYEYDVESGLCVADGKRARVKAYKVRVVEGRVCVEK
jgi:3-phenylpropionate/trans-cinnamate dioxygenase ferredoxin subunit